MFYIYILIDPRDNRIRYVGQTSNIKLRYQKHCKRQQQKNHRGNWLSLLHSLDLKPIMEVIEECSESVWADRETYWIKYYRELGCDLVNATDGGEGIPNPSVETRSKMSYAHKHRSKEHRLKIREIFLGNAFACGKRTEEYRLKRSGEGNPAVKLKEDDVINIRRLLYQGYNCTQLSKIYGVHRVTISDIKNRRTWGWLV